ASPQRTSTRRSLDTTLSAWTARTAIRRRCCGLPSRTRSPLRTTTTGPSTPSASVTLSSTGPSDARAVDTPPRSCRDPGARPIPHPLIEHIVPHLRKVGSGYARSGCDVSTGRRHQRSRLHRGEPRVRRDDGRGAWSPCEDLAQGPGREHL